MNTKAFLWSAFSVQLALGGAIDNRTNWSVEYIGNPNRNAAIRSVDAVAYNPGGAAFLPEGVMGGLDNQVVYKDYGHRFALPLQDPEEFRSEILSYFLPTAFGSYRWGDWGVHASLVIPGGGGGLEYEKGTHTTYPYVLGVRSKLGNPSFTVDAEFLSVYVAPQLGVTRNFLDTRLGVGLGVRYVNAWTEVNVTQPLPAPFPKDVIDFRESAQGVGGYFGVAYRPTNKSVVSFRYETPVVLEWEVEKSDINILPSGPDSLQTVAYIASLRGDRLKQEGTRHRRDLPGVLGLGTSYQVLESLLLNASFTWVSQDWGDWEGGEGEVDPAFEYGAGLEYTPRENLTLRMGALHSLQGAGPETYFTENPALNSYTVGAGFGFRPIRQMGLELGVTRSAGIEDEKPEPISKSFGVDSEIELDKVAWVFAAGLRFYLP